MAGYETWFTGATLIEIGVYEKNVTQIIFVYVIVYHVLVYSK